MQPDYLVKSRHGSCFYFRAVIPKQLRCFFPNRKREIKKSLKTDSKRVAVLRARAMRVEFDRLIASLMKKLPSNKTDRFPSCDYGPDDGLRQYLITLMTDLGEIRIEHDTPEKEAESAERLIASLAKTGMKPEKAAAPKAGLRQALLSEVIKLFIESKTKTSGTKGKPKWKDPTHQTGRLNTILEIIGDKPCHELTGLDAVKVEETLPKLPARLNQGELKGLPDILAKIATDPAKHKRMSQNTQSKSWGLFKELILFAKKKKYLATDITEDMDGISFTKKDKEDAGYDLFEDDELQRLFSGHIYQPEKLPRTKRNHSYCFWLPLLAAFTGARINELCQLRVSDIKQSDEGIWYIDITDEEEEGRLKKSKTLKSGAAKRVVPIHRQLLDLGFLDFVKEERTGENAHMLFTTGLTQSKKTGRWGNQASNWFNGYEPTNPEEKKKRGTDGYKQKCGFTTCSGKVFHSFRKSFATNLFNADQTNITQLSMLIGHEQVGNEKRNRTTFIYIKQIALSPLKAYIDKLEYNIDLSHVSYETFKRKYAK